MIKKPNFFIVGAARSGTTTIYEVLKKHPQVYMSIPIKEPAYFTKKYGSKEYSNFTNYTDLFKGAKEEKIIGEASTIYLYSEDAAKNIKEFNPDAKIFIQLREPISRAVSHYKRQVRLGVEKLGFEEALAQERYRVNNDEVPSLFYFSRGLYSKQLKRFFRYFKKEQIFITLYDDFQRDPKEVLFRLCDFLQIEKKYIPKKISITNAGNMPRFFWINKLMKSNKAFRKILKAIIPKNKKKLIIYNLKSKWNISSSNFEINIPEHVLLELKNKYKKDILDLKNLLNLDLSDWLTRY